MRFGDNIFITKERPVKVVPKAVMVLLVTALVLQINWHAHRPSASVRISSLPEPPHTLLLQAFSLGEQVTLSRLLMLWLQSFDYQPGISIPFKDLDYSRVIAWLDVILTLDSHSGYPLLSASRLYSQVPDPDKKRQMLEFVYDKYLEDPDSRWMWMAHAVYVAKHNIKDPELAYKYAKALRVYTTKETAPSWARQMELFVLEELGDIEGARILLGGLLESGVIKDANELTFLQGRLDDK